jgi:cyclopropane fatty-acyl-phospholipid synthase-like methyltransferase
MPVHTDPEDSETAALFDFAGNFGGKRVLEIGCGDGRLTWRYADHAAHVVAIDPDADEIAAAREDLPPRLRDRVELKAVSIQEFEPDAPAFDIVILSWAL